MGLYSHTVGYLLYWQQWGGGIGGRGLPNERPGSCSCDLRANERPQNKLHSIAQHTTDTQQTDIATLRLKMVDFTLI